VIELIDVFIFIYVVIALLI